MATSSGEEGDEQACDILAGLIALPDSDLRKVLPGYQPASVRNSLQPLLDKLRPPAPSPGPAPPGEDATPPAQTKQSGTLYLYTDGAARGNPGEAGAGIALFDDRDREILGRGYYLGQCTNNVAEYKALIYGLTEAAKTGCTSLVVSLDSQLIVRQLTGQYKVKNAGLKPLFSEVQRLLKAFPDYSVKHIPREENSRADSLANRGIDEAGR